MNSSQLKKMDVVKILAVLNIRPTKIRGFYFWYLSPFREEKTPSFKVDTSQNIWIDFGVATDQKRGGSIIDFFMKYFHVSFTDAISRLNEMLGDDHFSFHSQTNPLKPGIGREKKKIEVIAASPITHPALCRYLHNRNISLDLARKYCKEVDYSLYGKKYYAIGFPNNSGGYELRNAYFKGSSSPKDVTSISEEDAKEVAVFEGFFSFLSYLQLKKNSAIQLPKLQTNFLILNSLSFFEKSKNILAEYEQINLFLDNDQAGNKATEKALSRGEKYKDLRKLYAGFKDFNDYLIQKRLKQNRRRGMRL